MSKLDFSVVQNNDKTLNIQILDQDDQPVDGTPLVPLVLKWQWFVPGTPITKNSSEIAIVTTNPLVVGVALLPADTVSVPPGTYPHELVVVDTDGDVSTITNNDAQLTWGVGFLRQQKTVQP
jgi:hypothetical protein